MRCDLKSSGLERSAGAAAVYKPRVSATLSQSIFALHVPCVGAYGHVRVEGQRKYCSADAFAAEDGGTLKILPAAGAGAVADAVDEGP